MSEWWANELYSQFGEDGVLLAFFRARAHARDGNMADLGDGFYVDVGAHDPRVLSNTWHFYQRGWRGINIEPTPGVIEEFNSLRPRDVNLQIAISEKDGEATFYSSGRAVSNSFDLSSIDPALNPQGIVVKTSTLEKVLDDHLPKDVEFSFLSIDTEGFDLIVLQSNNWEKYRPLLVVVEVHAPNIDKAIASNVYKYMIGCGYRLHGWTLPSLIFVRN